MVKLFAAGIGFSLLAYGMAQAVVSYTAKPGTAPAAVAARPQAPAQRPSAQPVAQKGATQNDPRSVSLSADASGHFVADVKINGLFIQGLFDTGATHIALPLKEAQRLGIAPKPTDYTIPLNTASGETLAARVRLGEVRLETIVVRDIEALVIKEGLDIMLVGMSFFRQLQSSEMRGAMLVLRQ